MSLDIDVTELREQLREAARGDANRYAAIALRTLRVAAIVQSAVDLELLEIIVARSRRCASKGDAEHVAYFEEATELLAAARAFRERAPARLR